jgi:hypothetical protein
LRIPFCFQKQVLSHTELYDQIMFAPHFSTYQRWMQTCSTQKAFPEKRILDARRRHAGAWSQAGTFTNLFTKVSHFA